MPTGFDKGSLAVSEQKRLGDAILLAKVMRLQESRRTPNIAGSINYVDKVVQTPYNNSLLCVYSLFNPVLRLVHDAIIREVMKARKNGKCYDIVPRFKWVCTVCGYESQKDESAKQEEKQTEKPTPLLAKAEDEKRKAKCPVCGQPMREPDLEQKTTAEDFFENPNESSETADIIKSVLRFALAVDDWYLSITANPIKIYVEDSRHMKVVADELGRLGNGEYFCPECIREAQARSEAADVSVDASEVVSAQEKVYAKGKSCPKHPGVELIETCYVYQDGSTVKARFGKDEVIHKFNDAWLPDLYGHSKVVAVLRQIRSVTAMDKWNFDTYSSGKTGQIIAFKDMDQDEVNQIAADAEEDAKKLEEDADTGEVNKKLRTLWLSTKAGIDVADVMPPSDKMQSKEWWELWRETVGSVYGVQAVFMGATEEGKTGYHQQMQILVQNDTTLLYQQMIEEPFNEVLLPRIGVRDWLFKFCEIEEKNELADIQILREKVAAVIEAANAEMSAELTEDGEVKIHGKPKKQEFGFNQPFGDKTGKPKPAKTEQATSPLETTVKAHDKRYTVIEHED